jgi:hypothetical protein
MPEYIGADGAAFNTKIPVINENADIQTAFKLYHYGENSSGLGTLNADSVAGFLQSLEDNKIDINPSIIPTSADLNNYTASGFYAQNSNAKASSGINFPLVPPIIGQPYAGLLRVINDGSNIYQEYQVAGIPTNPVYWRAFFGNLGWTDWQTFAQDGHVHDDRYYTKNQADNRYLPAIKYLNIRQPLLSSSNYTLSLLDENALVMIDNLSLPNTVTIPTNTSVAFVVGTQITVLQKNTGQTTIQGQPGVTVRSTPGNRLRTIWSSASLIKIGQNEWVVIGDLT